MWTPSSANNTYALEIDGIKCFVVGGNVPANAWTWVSNQNGSAATRVDLSLTQGSHSVRLIGLAPGVKLDRLVATSDLACTPVASDGHECNTPDDTTAPVVSITAPAANATLSGTQNVAATASDNLGIAKVVFFVDNAQQVSDTTSPYGFSWDTTTLANNTYSVTAKAYDAAGNVSTDSRSVAVKNGDKTAPTTPTSFVGTAGTNKVSLNWSASTDNVAVVGYNLTRNGLPLETLGTVTSYVDDTVNANTRYTYTLVARDAAGNLSSPASVSATTANPTDTQAPTAPGNLRADAVSQSQINLRWDASSDNIGVVGYEVWRQTGVSPSQKIANTASTTFGDTTLKGNTKYTYTVKARDAAGNVSGASSPAVATTRSTTKHSELIGTIRDHQSKPIAGAKVSLVIDGKPTTFTATSKGTYDIEPISGGKYRLIYTANGYRTSIIDRNINANARVNQNATLEKK